MSLNKDNSHSWVGISHGLNKLVTDLSNNKEDNNNEQETSEVQFEDFALAIILYKTLQHIKSRRLFRWKLEQSCATKCVSHLARLR